MALQYKRVQKRNPSKPEDPRKFYANAITAGEVTLRTMLDEIAVISTVSHADTQAVIESLLQLIPKHLSEGRIVRLGDFGSFGVRLSSEDADTEEEITGSLLKKPKLNFRPGVEIRKVPDKATFRKA